MATGDKYDPLILPYCKPTPSQVLILQSCPLLSPQLEEDADVIPSSSSSEEEEQATGIIMVSLPDSSDDNYQTPPEEHNSISQNVAVDEAGNVVDLDNDTEEILDDDKIVTEEEAFDTEPQKDADQVFDEMPEREHEASKSDVAVLDRGKRKLPVSLDKKVTENGERGGECSKHDVFQETINRVLKMLVAEGKGKGCDDGNGVDFLETAKKKGMTFPRPRWRSAETWKGL